MALMDDLKSLLNKGGDRTKAEEAKLAAGVQQLTQTTKRAQSRALTMQERAMCTGRDLLLDGLELGTAGTLALTRGYYDGDLSLWGFDLPMVLGSVGLLGSFGAKLYGMDGADWLRAPARGALLEGITHKAQKLGAEMKTAANKPKPGSVAQPDPAAVAALKAREKAENKDLNADGVIGRRPLLASPGLPDQRLADPRFQSRVLAQTGPTPGPRRVAINPSGGRAGLPFPG